MSNNLYSFKEEYDKQGILLSFYGSFSQELLVEIGDTLKNRMKIEALNSAKMTRVFAMFIEQVQNIIHYSAEKISNEDLNSGSLSNGIVVVGYKNDYYYVVCGNKIKKKDIEKLTDKLTVLHNMDKAELKSFYKEQRKKEPVTKGAGLGFIELARKSAKPIDFDFQSIDEQFSFFSLKTYI
ncbi:MAG TPA: hypothetical protein ENK59_08670 [Thioploca sp.]|nr:hypothetical protein [Thioploca sp.]